MFERAIVKLPAENFADGITSSHFGSPNFALTLLQHRDYCRALASCGLNITYLNPDPNFPDSTFVEDTAVVTDKYAVITRPGAPKRRHETDSIARELVDFCERLDFIRPPGRIDGGDVCELGNSRILIGISKRTNISGANQLAKYLRAAGKTPVLLDIREFNGLLHLKSGVSYLGDDRVLTVESLADLEIFRGFEAIVLPDGEEYAANCIRVNDYLLTPEGFPKIHKRLEQLNYRLIKLDMSEFQKMDGGLSCLSLRF